MTRPRSKTLPGFRIQPMLPLCFNGDLGTVIEADFTKYDGVDCVEASVRIGMVTNPYTLVLTIAQALTADIIERD